MTPEQLTGLTDTHLCSERRLHPAAADALDAMIQAARDEGIEITVASGFRDFFRQQAIWDGKFTGQRTVLDSQSRPIDPLQLTEVERMHTLLRWSAIPGTSRHHWGTDIDLYSKPLLPEGVQLALEPWEYLEGGHQYPLYHWLQVNAQRFGFFFPYAKDQGGVSAEPWHLSFRPISEICSRELTPEVVRAALINNQVAGHHTLDTHLDAIFLRYIHNICN
uniref:M15 family metallopeptidase n=1 Tax=Thaumasiovibrio occultus TaxID=1891184 RepID=UPI000B35C0FC|nr:M15 family metallopeptidase [Thaumasiovibrio occultus]